MAGYGKVDLNTKEGRATYGKAYGAQQNQAYKGTKGRQNLGVSNAEFKAYGQKGGSFPMPFGGGGGGDMGLLAQQEYDRQMGLMDKIGEMSAGYSSDNTLGTTDIDYENKMITERLSPELQAQYDALLARSKASQDRVGAMGADPYEMQQYLYDANMELKRPEQDALRDDTMSILLSICT